MMKALPFFSTSVIFFSHFWIDDYNVQIKQIKIEIKW